MLTFLLFLFVQPAALPPSSDPAWMAQLERLYRSPVDTAKPPAALLERWRTHSRSGFRAHFEQEKRIAVLKRPLRASGQLVFVPGMGLYRSQERPFSVELWLDSKRMAQRESGKALKSLPLEREPVAFAFANAFLSLFGGSLENWSKHFDCFLLTNGTSSWLLGLRPKDPLLARMIRDLTLVVEDGLPKEILIREHNGDQTLDRLSQQVLIPESDWANQRALFNP